MINFDGITKENMKEHNPNWPQIHDHPYIILIIGGFELNIYLVFITRFCFSVPKSIRLNSKHYFVMKIQNKREPEQIAFNH